MSFRLQADKVFNNLVVVNQVTGDLSIRAITQPYRRPVSKERKFNSANYVGELIFNGLGGNAFRRNAFSVRRDGFFTTLQTVRPVLQL